jgi:hypothetical protein
MQAKEEWPTVLKGETKAYQSDGRFSIYIPAGVMKDSTFPFMPDDRLTIRIDGKRLVIEKAGKEG